MGVPAVREARRGRGLPMHGHSRAGPRSIHRVLHNGPRDAGDVAYAIRETGGAIAVLKSPRGSQRFELNWYPPRGRYRVYRQGDELDHLAFAVPDVDRFLREHRGDPRVVMKAFDEGTDRLAYVTDPDGAWIELMSRRKSSKRPVRGSP